MEHYGKQKFKYLIILSRRYNLNIMLQMTEQLILPGYSSTKQYHRWICTCVMYQLQYLEHYLGSRYYSLPIPCHKVRRTVYQWQERYAASQLELKVETARAPIHNTNTYMHAHSHTYTNVHKGTSSWGWQ